MARITFIILAHENAGHVIELARLLTEWDGDAHAVIHYDLNSPDVQYQRLAQTFASSDRIHLIEDRIRCGWGDFSLVEAVLRGLRLVRDRQIGCDRVMLVSGACMPIRPLRGLSAYLDAHPTLEFIEAYDSNWIVGGLREDRYRYRHFVNHRRNYHTFRYLHFLQKWLRLKRKMPAGMAPKFGSQWWTLSWGLCDRILSFLDRNPDVYAFFRTTWIPDELFFQTLAHHLAPADSLPGHNLTFYQFNDWGLPLVFSDANRSLIESIPRFFARKIGPWAAGLKRHLRDIANAPHDPATALPSLPVKWQFPARALARRNAELSPGHRRVFVDSALAETGENRGVPHNLRSNRSITARLQLMMRFIVRQTARFWTGLYFLPRVRICIDRTKAISGRDVLLIACDDRWTGDIAGFCDYYRRLGVSHFLFIDHGRDQNCRNVVRDSADVSVFSATGSFGRAGNGYEWRNLLLKRYALNNFCLLADPGEYLVFPFQEDRKIGELADLLRNERKESLHAVIIDGYARDPLDVAGAGSGVVDPFALCPYFDKDGYYSSDVGDGHMVVVGGPSLRLAARTQPKAAPPINRVIGVWWKWSYYFLADGRRVRPEKLARVSNLGSPIVSAALFRFPQIEAIRDGRSSQTMTRRFGTDIARAVAAGDTLYLDGVSTKYGTSGDLMKIGLISTGNWF